MKLSIITTIIIFTLTLLCIIQSYEVEAREDEEVTPKKKKVGRDDFIEDDDDSAKKKTKKKSHIQSVAEDTSAVDVEDVKVDVDVVVKKKKKKVKKDPDEPPPPPVIKPAKVFNATELFAKYGTCENKTVVFNPIVITKTGASATLCMPFLKDYYCVAACVGYKYGGINRETKKWNATLILNDLAITDFLEKQKLGLKLFEKCTRNVFVEEPAYMSPFQTAAYDNQRCPEVEKVEACLDKIYKKLCFPPDEDEEEE